MICGRAYFVGEKIGIVHTCAHAPEREYASTLRPHAPTDADARPNSSYEQHPTCERAVADARVLLRRICRAVSHADDRKLVREFMPLSAL